MICPLAWAANDMTITQGGSANLTITNSGSAETDPQVDAVTNGNFCKGDGSAVQCSTTANAGTDITADLEEEVTEGSLADSTIVSGDIKDGTIAEGDTSFIVTAGADPDVDATKELGVDTDDFWLRGWDGSAQYVVGQKAKIISFTVANPDLLTEAAFVPIWTNKTGATFNIVAVYSTSDVDDAAYTLKYTTNSYSDHTNLTTVEAITISTDGTGVYYNDLTASIDDTTVEADKTIGFDNGATDCDFIHGVIIGYLDSNVN